MGRFKKGLFLGGLFGAGLMWLNVTKKGKQMRSELIDHAAEVYTQVRQKIEESGTMDKITKNKYVATVQEVVDKYAQKYDLGDNAKKMLTKLVGAQWKQSKKK